MQVLCLYGPRYQYKPPWAYIRRGDLTENFLRYEFEGLIFGGAYTWRSFFSEFYEYIDRKNDLFMGHRSLHLA